MNIPNTNKRAGWNKCAGENFFPKSINVQTKIRPCRGDFFLKINKRACMSIRYTRVLHILSKTWPIVIAWNLTIGTIIIETHPLFYFLSFVPYFFSAQNMDHLLLFMDLSLEWLFLSFEFRKISQPSGQNILLSWGHKLELKFSRVTFSDAFWED